MTEPASDAERFLSQRIVSDAQFADSDDDRENADKGDGDTSESGWMSATQYSQAEDWNGLAANSDEDDVEEYSDEDDAVDGWYVSESEDENSVVAASDDDDDNEHGLGVTFEGDDDGGEVVADGSCVEVPVTPLTRRPKARRAKQKSSRVDSGDEALETFTTSTTSPEPSIIDNGDGTVTGSRGGRYSKCWTEFLKPRRPSSQPSGASPARRSNADSDANESDVVTDDDFGDQQHRTHTRSFLSRHIDVYANERIVMPTDIDSETYNADDPEAEIYGLLQCDMTSFVDLRTQVYILPGQNAPISQKNMLIDRVTAYCVERDQRDRVVDEFNDAQQQEAQDTAARRNRRHNLFDHRDESDDEDEALHRINDLVTTAPNISMFTQGTREYVRAEHDVLRHQRERAEQRRIRNGYHPTLGIGNGKPCVLCRYHIRGSLQDKPISVVKMAQMWAERMSNKDYETTWVMLMDHWNNEVVGDSKVASSSIPRLNESDMEWHYVWEGVDAIVIESVRMAEIVSLAIHKTADSDLFVRERIGGRDTNNVSPSKKSLATLTRTCDFYLKLLRTINVNVRVERAVAGTVLGMMPGVPNARMTLGFSDQVRLGRRTHETQDENASRAIAQMIG